MRTGSFQMSRRLVWAAAMLLALPVGAHASADRGYRWTNEGSMLQYGVPETDDRSARFDCDAKGGVQFTLPGWAALPPGGVPIAVTQGGETEMFIGQQDNSGDGLIVTAPLKPGSLLVRSLSQGRDVRIVSGHLDMPLTSAGAAGPMTQFIKGCSGPARPH